MGLGFPWEMLTFTSTYFREAKKMNYNLMKEDTEVDIYNNLGIESRISKIGNWHCSVLSI